MIVNHFYESEELFKSYRGSHYQMYREDVLDKYKKFKVPKETEITWLREMQSEALICLANATNNKKRAESFSYYSDTVVQLKDRDGLYYMIEYVKENFKSLDSNTVIRCINSIMNSLNVFDNITLKSEVTLGCLHILKELLQFPIYISNDYLEHGIMPDYLTVDKIKENMMDMITHYKYII